MILHRPPRVSSDLFAEPVGIRVPQADVRWHVPRTESWLCMRFAQAWLASSESGFRGGEVRLANAGHELLVLADLDDDDVYCPPVAFNEAAFLRGDVFEFFIAPEGQPVYFEFHVTPANQRYQLRLTPHGNTARRNLIWETPVESRTRLRPGGWQVFLKVNLSELVVPGNRLQPHNWQVSCSRYDWTRGNSSPVLSSTSPHRALNFHRRHEWTRLAL